jgi:hypothetical protein
MMILKATLIWEDKKIVPTVTQNSNIVYNIGNNFYKVLPNQVLLCPAFNKKLTRWPGIRKSN